MDLFSTIWVIIHITLVIICIAMVFDILIWDGELICDKIHLFFYNKRHKKDTIIKELDYLIDNKSNHYTIYKGEVFQLKHLTSKIRVSRIISLYLNKNLKVFNTENEAKIYLKIMEKKKRMRYLN